MAASAGLLGCSCLKESTVLEVTEGEYEVSILRHFFGHASTQAAQEMQRRRSISHIFSCLFTRIASVGHFFWQSVQNVHF